MAVNPGDSITAAQYNGLQSRIEQVLGNGSGNFGYGQAVTSAQITAPSSAGAGDGDSVTAAQMDNVRSDMNKVYAHIYGSNIPIKNIEVGDVIGADQTGDTVTYDNQGNYTITFSSSTVLTVPVTVDSGNDTNGGQVRFSTGDSTLKTWLSNNVNSGLVEFGDSDDQLTVTQFRYSTITIVGDLVTLGNVYDFAVIDANYTGSAYIKYTPSGPADNTGGFNDYLARMDDLETNRFAIHAGQNTVADIATDTRTSTWNGTINCIFQCSFTSADHRRHFFNSGGQIRLLSSGANGSGSKSSDWLSMITNPGQIQFGYNYTTITGSTSGVTLGNIGNYGLTTSFQTIMEKQGSAAVYAENRYRVEARAVSTSVIEFRISFEDNDAGDQQAIPPAPYGPAVDENVDLDITVTLATRRASGSNVSVNNPSVSVTNTLE